MPRSIGALRCVACKAFLMLQVLTDLARHPADKEVQIARDCDMILISIRIKDVNQWLHPKRIASPGSMSISRSDKGGMGPLIAGAMITTPDANILIINPQASASSCEFPGMERSAFVAEMDDPVLRQAKANG